MPIGRSGSLSPARERRTAFAMAHDLDMRVIAEALDVSPSRIEHVGSTSVPGLAAKPTIDINAASTTAA